MKIEKFLFDCFHKKVEWFKIQECNGIIDSESDVNNVNNTFKILSSWNGLMITGYCRAGLGLNNTEYITAAQTCGKFVIKHLFDHQVGIILRHLI